MGGLLSRLRRSCDGNIALLAAFLLPVVLIALAFGVDYGMLTLQRQRLQRLSDLGAIVAASDSRDPAGELLNFLRQSIENPLVRLNGSAVSSAGAVSSANTDLDRYDAVAELQLGSYSADSSVAIGNRFVANKQPYNAARVVLQEKGDLAFAAALISPPVLTGVGTAQNEKLAAYSIGSRLASLNGGILNGILGALLGSSISLSVADYNALAGVNVNLFTASDLLATKLGLTALTYGELLETEITLPQLLTALAGATTSPAASNAVNTLQKASQKSSLTLKLGDLLSLGSVDDRLVGQSSGLKVSVNLLDAITTALVAANGESQLSLALNAGISGIAEVSLKLAIGEPMQDTPSATVGAVGGLVRTSQVRLLVTVKVAALPPISDGIVNLPVYVELASAEAKLASITCSGSPTTATVGIDAIPSVAQIAIGNVDTKAFNNFSSTPKVTAAKILDLLLLSISAKADIQVTNSSATRLTFSQADITAATLKSAYTKNALTTAVTTLLGNTELKVNLLGIPLIDVGTILSSLKNTLAALTTPLDTLLTNVLLALGIRVGEVDVRVTDVRCFQPTLVQ